jgi:hypothetical protein
MREREQHVSKAVEVASNCSDYGFTYAEKLNFENILAQYSDEMVARIYRLLTQRRNTLIRKKDYNLKSFVGIILTRPSEAELKQFLWFAPKLNTDLGFSFTMINGLKNIDGLPTSDDYSTASVEVRTQCLALIRVGSAMQEYASEPPLARKDVTPNYPERYISDTRVSSMIIDKPELAVRIIEVIKENERADFGLIDAMLHGGNIPLSAGVL